MTAMIHSLSSDQHASFLAGYRLTPLSFAETDHSFPSVNRVWRSIREGRLEEAAETIRDEMQTERIFGCEERAALEVALAHIALVTGSTDTARRRAGRSLDLHPDQFAAHRILLITLSARKDFAAAYLHLANLPLPAESRSWDEIIDARELATTLAAWAWQLGEWDQVADHIETAWPEGLDAMPPELREDWFRLSLYRGVAEDAAAAAALLIDDRPLERADELLQTIVQNGWEEQALPLYRTFFEQRPQSELLRRRLVGLCIKAGEIEEARSLTKPGALRLAA